VGPRVAVYCRDRAGIAARRQEARLEMVGADDAEKLRLDRLAVPLHRRQELGDTDAVDLLDAEELRQRLMRAADLGEDLALHGGAGQPAKLGDELAHGAITSKIEIAGDMGGEITLESALVVPMRAGRIARPPFLPIWIGGRDVDELLAVPDPVQT